MGADQGFNSRESVLLLTVALKQNVTYFEI